MDFKIIFEDQHIMVVEKPPKVPSQKDKTNDLDLLTMIKEYLIQSHPKAQDPYVALLHRLDRPVGGVMIYAKTKYASSRLSEQIQKKQVSKSYLGVVCGQPIYPKGILKHYLVKNGALNFSKVVKKPQNNAKEAVLEYEVLDTKGSNGENLSLVKFNLITGRHHQIRVQTSHEGWPLWGDNKYNEAFQDRKGWTQIALWSYELSFTHPKTNKQQVYYSKPVDEFPFNLFEMKK
jgi:23S rRNA pseudouridine1911/1915/1917 synthase